MAPRLALPALALVAALAGTSGCTRKDEPPTPAVQLANDRVTLDAIVASDVDLDAVLKLADDQSRMGNDAAAADTLEQRAIPVADAALARARAATVTTSWAVARREEWLAILQDRRAQTARYASALRGEDLDAKLAAVEAQAELTKRAMAAALAVRLGPDT